MNRHTLYIIMAAVVAVCAGCSGDDADSAPSTSSQPWTVTVPIEIVTSSVPSSRTTGDPGVDDELDPPANVYAFSWVQTASAPTYQFCYVARTGLTASNWTYSLGDSGTEDEDSRYKLNGGLSLTFESDPYASMAGVIGHTYVIASEKELTESQLKGIYSSVTSDALSSGAVVTGLSRKPDDSLKTATVSFSGCFTDTEGAWQSDDFRDLYSNPVGNKNGDSYEYGDIYATSDDGDGYTFTHTEVRLYHCAAKIDFTWEVDTALQATTSVDTIKVSSLPTVCKIFQPTSNLTENTTSYAISTDDGNKWIGREYFYALQPSAGYLTYGVTFGGSSSRTAVSGATTTNSADYSSVFTGWFRVIATVSETE